MRYQNVYSIYSVPLFGTCQKLMLQLLHQKLPYLAWFTGLWNDKKKCKIMTQIFMEGRGSDIKLKCPIFLCPKAPWKGGCQVRMVQCHI